MTLHHGISTRLLTGFWIVTLVAVWACIAPVQVGGTASYVIVIGNSMEPDFLIGDLIIVRRQPGYDAGDAVAYKNGEIGSLVFHRILSAEMGHYVLQGDNNSWVDTYEPSDEEVLGKLWLHIPGGGTIMQKIRTPIYSSLIAGALGCMLAAGLFAGKSKGRKPMNKIPGLQQIVSAVKGAQNWFTGMDTPERREPSDPVRVNWLELSLFSLGIVAFATFLLAVVAFSLPSTRPIQDEISYDHVAIFSYAGPAPLGVYDSNIIASGDPIFPRLTCSVDISFQYTLIAQQAGKVAGNYQLTALISEPYSGWRRTVPLQNKTAFQGNAVGSTAMLNLCQMEALVQAMEEATDYHPGAYILSITPNIEVGGELSGRILQTTFNPALTFRYEQDHFHLEAEAEQDSPLHAAESGVLSETRSTANTIILFGRELAIPALRSTALVGLVLSLSGLAYLGTQVKKLGRHETNKLIQMKFGAFMIDVRHADPSRPAHIVEVSSIEALAKLAERAGSMILHTEQGQNHAYEVLDKETVYRYILHTGSTQASIRPQQTKRPVTL